MAESSEQNGIGRRWLVAADSHRRRIAVPCFACRGGDREPRPDRTDGAHWRVRRLHLLPAADRRRLAFLRRPARRPLEGYLVDHPRWLHARQCPAAHPSPDGLRRAVSARRRKLGCRRRRGRSPGDPGQHPGPARRPDLSLHAGSGRHARRPAGVLGLGPDLVRHGWALRARADDGTRRHLPLRDQRRDPDEPGGDPDRTRPRPGEEVQEERGRRRRSRPRRRGRRKRRSAGGRRGRRRARPRRRALLRGAPWRPR